MCFGIEFIVNFVEVIFFDSLSNSCLSVLLASYCICLVLSVIFSEQVILVKFFLNTAESSKRIWLYRTRYGMYVDHTPSFSESGHKSKNKVLNKKIRVVRPRRSNSSAFSHAG